MRFACIGRFQSQLGRTYWRYENCPVFRVAGRCRMLVGLSVAGHLFKVLECGTPEREELKW